LWSEYSIYGIQLIALRIAGDKKIPIGKSIVEAHVSFGRTEDDTAFSLAVELHAILPESDTEKGMDVVRGAHLMCPYSNATRNNIEVTLTVAPKDGVVYAVI